MSGLPSREQIRDFEMIFSFHDIYRKGRVETKNLESMLYFFNKKYTIDALKKMMLDVDRDCKGFFTCHEFIAFMTRLMLEEHKMKMQKRETSAGTSEKRAKDEDAAGTSEMRATEQDAAGNSGLRYKQEDTAGTSELHAKEEVATSTWELCAKEEQCKGKYI